MNVQANGKPRSQSRKRPKVVAFRVDEQELADLKRVAAANGMSLAEFCRTVATFSALVSGAS